MIDESMMGEILVITALDHHYYEGDVGDDNINYAFLRTIGELHSIRKHEIWLRASKVWFGNKEISSDRQSMFCILKSAIIKVEKVKEMDVVMDKSDKVYEPSLEELAKRVQEKIKAKEESNAD